MNVVTRFCYRLLNRWLVFLFRLGFGRLLDLTRPLTGRILVLGTQGRVTGRLRRTPLNYTPIPGGVLCVAGYGESSHWYQNLRRNPEVEVWLPQQGWRGRAREVPLQLPQLRALLRDSGWLARRLAGVDAGDSDEKLSRRTADYRAIEILTDC